MNDAAFTLADFDYAFPKELVAQHPPTERDQSRMMVVDRNSKTFENKKFTDIFSYLRAGDVLILNDALADLIPFEDKLVPPLPPYIKRKTAEDFTQNDVERYRSVYGKSPGSKAAPTAGFHFTTEILKKIQAIGVEIGYVTLHVDYDTYKPIRSEDIREHPMHGEKYEIPAATLELIVKAKSEKRRVVAVGTTSVRVLESWAAHIIAQPGEGLPSGSCGTRHSNGSDSPWSLQESPPQVGVTHLFIFPGYQFKIVDAMLTNFHRPRSTVLVMVSAFAGTELIRASYQKAIEEQYRLFSYGDCMLIL